MIFSYPWIERCYNCGKRILVIRHFGIERCRICGVPRIVHYWTQYYRHKVNLRTFSCQ